MNFENVPERQPSFAPFIAKNLSEEEREIFLQKILSLEQKIFPPDWQYEDAEMYYREMLESPSAINIFLRGDNNEVAGYLLAKPLSEVYEELAQDDPALKNDEYCYYIETTEILPKYAKGRGSFKFLSALQKEIEENHLEYTTISAHARVSNGLADVLVRRVKKNLIEERSIERWAHGGGEPYKYIQWAIEKQEDTL
ncbi:MAG: hypothetical protein EOM19_03075 [Candidatus Moranbacteria bacterium]|nr:hypothetical protein [Candidatus Moranbacteria bacterium]